LWLERVRVPRVRGTITHAESHVKVAISGVGDVVTVLTAHLERIGAPVGLGWRVWRRLRPLRGARAAAEAKVR
jgi:hypothetical protein